jgi:hypothetical protein
VTVCKVDVGYVTPVVAMMRMFALWWACFTTPVEHIHHSTAAPACPLLLWHSRFELF